MNLLFEIGHPAHVHFFSRTIRRLQREGHDVSVVTRNKDITNSLLDGMGIPYECLSAPARGKVRMLRELAGRWAKTLGLIRRKKIDRAISISGITTSLPARVAGIGNVVFTDTEDAKISNKIAFPFADVICTPQFFLGDLGKKHHRYPGLHELAYLQHFDLEKAKETRRALGLPDRYVILRAVRNDALHDADIRGLSETDMRQLIDVFSHVGQVFLTCEGGAPASLKGYELKTPIEHIHAVLAGAEWFVGESPTMAVESSLLGTPAFLISQRASRLGNMINLEKEYHLLRNFSSWNEFRAFLKDHPDLGETKSAWGERARQYRQSQPDMDEYIRQVSLGNL
jgi:predicted glycosyltransferase